MRRDTRTLSACSTLALLLALAMTTPAQAEIYKWTDKQGGVHYSETPPAGIKYETLNPRFAPAQAAPAAQPQAAPDNEQQKQEKQRAEQERAYKEEQARIRQQNCEAAQKRLANLQSAPRIVITNPDGTVQRLNDEERQARIDEVQAQVSQNCD